MQIVLNHGFYVSHSFFREKARGWVDGVYYPRTEQVVFKEVKALKQKDGCWVLPARVWRETEETGFGVFEYEEAHTLHIPLENGDYSVSVTLACPRGEPFGVTVKANGIVKAKEAPINGEYTLLTFPAFIIKGILDLKILPECTCTQREEAELKEVYVREVRLRKEPEKEAGKKPVVYLVSDSTVQSYSPSEFPQAGWGQMLFRYFCDNENEAAALSAMGKEERTKVYDTARVTIENHAIGGRSSRSFVDEGRLDAVLEKIRPGDFLFIQFGHNDATASRPNRYVPSTAFRDYLLYYIEGARQRQAVPVLITPVARRNCGEEEGSFTISFSGYREVMYDLSRERRVPLLDLGRESTACLNALGVEESKKLYLWIEPGEYPQSKFSEGIRDNTHLKEGGALRFAGVVAGLIAGYEDDEQLDPLKGLINRRELTQALERG